GVVDWRGELSLKKVRTLFRRRSGAQFVKRAGATRKQSERRRTTEAAVVASGRARPCARQLEFAWAPAFPQPSGLRRVRGRKRHLAGRSPRSPQACGLAPT